MKTIIIKCILILFLIFLLCICFFKGIDLMSDIKIDMVNVYVARYDIAPRTELTMNDLSILKIPSYYISEHVYTNKEDIIGKFTDIQGKIPRGSLFYKSMLYDKEQMPDNPVTQLLENQVCYSMATDIIQLSGNTIVEGERVDVYGSLQLDKIPVIDLLLENVRVISIKDSKGLNMNDEQSNGIPSVILLAVNKDSIELLNQLEKIGSIQLYSTSNSYEENEAVLNKKSKLIELLKNE